MGQVAASVLPIVQGYSGGGSVSSGKMGYSTTSNYTKTVVAMDYSTYGVSNNVAKFVPKQSLPKLTILPSADLQMGSPQTSAYGMSLSPPGSRNGSPLRSPKVFSQSILRENENCSPLPSPKVTLEQSQTIRYQLNEGAHHAVISPYPKKSELNSMNPMPIAPLPFRQRSNSNDAMAMALECAIALGSASTHNSVLDTIVSSAPLDGASIGLLNNQSSITSFGFQETSKSIENRIEFFPSVVPVDMPIFSFDLDDGQDSAECEDLILKGDIGGDEKSNSSNSKNDSVELVAFQSAISDDFQPVELSASLFPNHLIDECDWGEACLLKPDILSNDLSSPDGNTEVVAPKVFSFSEEHVNKKMRALNSLLDTKTSFSSSLEKPTSKAVKVGVPFLSFILHSEFSDCTVHFFDKYNPRIPSRACKKNQHQRAVSLPAVSPLKSNLKPLQHKLHFETLSIMMKENAALKLDTHFAKSGSFLSKYSADQALSKRYYFRVNPDDGFLFWAEKQGEILEEGFFSLCCNYYCRMFIQRSLFANGSQVQEF